MLNTARSTGTITLTSLTQFARRLTPKIYENVYGAVYSLIEVLHKEVMKWQATATKEEWDQLIVVISSGHMNRLQNVAEYNSLIAPLTSSSVC